MSTAGWDDWRLSFYFATQLVGGAGLTLMLLTVLSSWNKVRCNPVLTSFCFTWWLTTFPCLTLLLFGKSVVGLPPPQPLCMASAALVMAQTPMVVTSSLALVVHVWSLLSKRIRHRLEVPWFLRPSVLIAAPYIAFLVTIAIALILGLMQPGTVHRVVFYCIVDIRPITIVIGTFTAVVIVTTMIFEVLIFSNVRELRNSVNAPEIDFSLVIRVLIFGLYICLALGMAIVSAIDWTSVIPDLLFSTFPLTVFLVFGSQKAFLHAWKSHIVRDRTDPRYPTAEISLPTGHSSERRGSTSKKCLFLPSSPSAHSAPIKFKEMFRRSGHLPTDPPRLDVDIDEHGLKSFLVMEVQRSHVTLDADVDTSSVISADPPPRLPPPAVSRNRAYLLPQGLATAGSLNDVDTRLDLAKPTGSVHDAAAPRYCY